MNAKLNSQLRGDKREFILETNTSEHRLGVFKSPCSTVEVDQDTFQILIISIIGEGFR